ncbi:FecCD family ABC transporter permease [Actinomycetospora lemnae]|uniref:Iron chelate uptake ABC transporter family permease subunit n=1 Tax=Actinomycetospora lemnae TaxID=3019891 RepID=A0ABT5T2R3_9PSEU|nr:iron chelate uptake ABC transporter family permease subunit [Actinomycetospora sp. DW7H6]MDD7969419.1 iron chelate uptake ABC transporter family permease subunit [Actinomycetospora sp. DW7H6]
MSTTLPTGPVVRTARVSLRVHPRTVTGVVVLLVVAVVLGAVALTLGDYQLSLGQVVGALTGTGSRAQQYVVLGLRLPRVAVALVVGAALGVAGAVFQSLARNNLASPDLLGFTTGAATGALVSIVVVGGGPAGTTIGAIVGTLVTALAVQALLGGAVGGYRLVLVGIGVNAVLAALNNFLILRTDLSTAVAAQSWLVGTLNGRSWPEVVAVAIALVVLVPVAIAGSRRLDLLGMGDDMARGLGVTVERTRVVTLLVGVALIGVATAAVGPIAFVALAAPQLARRVTGTTGPGMAAAGLMGAVLLLAGDVLGQRLAAPTQFPAGTMTAAIGGLYLVWLLAREWRAGR